MAKKTIRDLFVKLSNFFTDFYIIYNYYVLPGDKSDETTRGYYYCTLEPDIMDTSCKNRFRNLIYLVELY